MLEFVYAYCNLVVNQLVLHAIVQHKTFISGLLNL